MKQSISIYENQFIGSFIYSMGVITGKRELPVTDSINLLQQTPGDRIIGDLFTKWQGRNFIVEFKRNVNGLTTEIKKPMKQMLLENLNSMKYIEERVLSNKCHFIS